MDRLGKKLIFFSKKKAGIINRFNFGEINSSVIMLLNIHLNISVYGQDASTDRTFLHSKTPKSFLLQTIILVRWLTESCHPLVSHT